MIDAKFIREAALLPLAALCLGLAYNALSPLGVRFTGPAASLPVAVAPAADPDLRNETLTAAIVPGGPDAAEKPHPLLPAMTWPAVKIKLARREIVLVDGREPLAYEAGHIPGAVSLPLRLVREKIGAVLGKYPRTTPLVFYCASAQCGVAQTEALLVAEQFGYADVREMPGGYAEWLSAEPGTGAVTGAQP